VSSGQSRTHIDCSDYPLVNVWMDGWNDPKCSCSYLATRKADEPFATGCHVTNTPAVWILLSQEVARLSMFMWLRAHRVTIHRMVTSAVQVSSALEVLTDLFGIRNSPVTKVSSGQFCRSGNCEVFLSR